MKKGLFSFSYCLYSCYGDWLVQSLGHHGHCGRLGMLFFEGHTAKERGNDGHGRRGRREIPALLSTEGKTTGLESGLVVVP